MGRHGHEVIQHNSRSVQAKDHSYSSSSEDSVVVPSKMRIVAVQTGLSPNSVLGGTITDREFLTRLADRGVEIHVLTQQEGEPVLAHKNFVHHFWQRRIRRVPYTGNLDVARDLRHLLAKLGKVDWVRFNSAAGVGIGTVFAANGHRVWGSYLHCEDNRFRYWVDSHLPKYCDLITCLSEDTRRDLISRCKQANHANNVVVPVGIDLARFDAVRHLRDPLRAKLEVTEREVLVLFVGTLTPRKGISDMVRAWELLGANPNARLLIIGRRYGPHELGLVEDLVKTDPRVRYLEKVPYEEVPGYFQAADVFLFPTHLEGFGIVVGEAMACGLPVLTTRAKGVREVVVENETALVADVGRPEQLASHLDRLLTDADLRARLGSAGRERVKNFFQWETIIDSLMGRLQG